MARHLPQVISEEEFNRLASIPSLRSATGKRHRALLWLMYGCGLRASEVLNLSPRDISAPVPDHRACEFGAAREARTGAIFLSPQAPGRRWRGGSGAAKVKIPIYDARRRPALRPLPEGHGAALCRPGGRLQAGRRQ